MRLRDIILGPLATDNRGGTLGGEYLMNVNGAITPQVYGFTPREGGTARLHRVLVHVRATGTPMSAENFGNLTELTNGVIIEVVDMNANVLGFGSPILNIKSNTDWGRLAYDVTEHIYGNGDQYLQCRWTFDRAFREPREGLTLHEGELFRMTVQDDLSALADFTVVVQGEYIP